MCRISHDSKLRRYCDSIRVSAEFPCLILAAFLLSQWTPIPPQGNLLNRPDEIALFKVAVTRDCLNAPWSVHAPAFGILVHTMFSFLFRSRALVSVVNHLCLFIVATSWAILLTGHKEGKTSAGQYLVVVSLVFVGYGSPIVRALSFGFSEDLFCSVLVVAVLLLSASAKRSRSVCVLNTIFCILIATSHVYGLALSAALLFGIALVDYCDRSLRRNWLWPIAGCLVAFGMVLLLDNGYPGRHEALRSHYWLQKSPGISAPLLGLSEFVFDFVPLSKFWGYVTEWAIVCLLCFGALWGSRRCKILCVPSLGLVCLGLCLRCLGLFSSILPCHMAPCGLLILMASSGAAINLVSGRWLLASAVAVISLRLCLYLDAPHPSEESIIRVAKHVAAESGTIIVAGSRLYFLLEGEIDGFSDNRNVIVYQPSSDNCIGKSLVPDDLVLRSPEEVWQRFDSGLYVQMTGSQMIRLDIPRPDVVECQIYTTSTPSVGDIFVMSLKSAEQR